MSHHKLRVSGICAVLVCVLAACQTPRERAEAEMAAGVTALEAGDAVKAAEHFTKATEYDPELAAAWGKLARTQLDRELWKAAGDAAAVAAPF